MSGSFIYLFVWKIWKVGDFGLGKQLNLKMSNVSKTLEDSSAESNVDYESRFQEISEGNNINTQDRNHSCNILVKIVADFFPYFKNLPEDNCKSMY